MRAQKGMSSNTGGMGKKNRGKKKEQHPSSVWKTHDVEIDTRIAKLLKCLMANLLPTNATARALSSIFQLFATAATFDPDVAHAFIDSGESKCGSLLFDLVDRVQSCSSGTGDNQW